jgi:hypothetical protein
MENFTRLRFSFLTLMLIFVANCNILAQDSTNTVATRIIEVDNFEFRDYFSSVRERFGKHIVPHRAYVKVSFDTGSYQIDSFSGLDKLRYDIVSLRDTLKILPLDKILTEGKQSYILMYQKDAFTWVFEEVYDPAKGTYYLCGEDAWSDDMWTLIERLEFWNLVKVEN